MGDTVGAGGDGVAEGVGVATAIQVAAIGQDQGEQISGLYLLDGIVRRCSREHHEGTQSQNHYQRDNSFLHSTYPVSVWVSFILSCASKSCQGSHSVKLRACVGLQYIFCSE